MRVRDEKREKERVSVSVGVRYESRDKERIMRYGDIMCVQADEDDVRMKMRTSSIVAWSTRKEG